MRNDLAVAAVARGAQLLGLMCLLVGGLLVLPSSAQAAVSFSNDTTLTFTGLANLTLTVKSGSVAGSLTVSASTASVTVGADQIFTLESATAKHITNSQGATVTSCANDVSQVTFSVAGTYTFNPTDTAATCPSTYTGGGAARLMQTQAVVAPANPAAALTADNQVKITWTDSVMATSYQLWRGEGSGTQTPLSGAVIASGVGEYIDAAVVPGASYVYRLQAKNGFAQALTGDLSVTIPEAAAASPVVAPSNTVVPEPEIAPVVPLRPAAPSAMPYTPSIYKDVPSAHWLVAQGYAQRLQTAGIMSGQNGELRPDDRLTRAELLKMVFKAFGLSAAVSSSHFQDVVAGAWYASYFEAAYQLGIVSGQTTVAGVRLARPNEPITRAEALKIIARAAGFDEGKLAVTGFKDVMLTDWSAPFVRYFKTNNIVGGYEDGTFGPAGNITRAEAAKVMAKSMDHKQGLK